MAGISLGFVLLEGFGQVVDNFGVPIEGTGNACFDGKRPIVI